jgi:phosphatidylglycerol:prolipoprotein diacylglycerol transferase
MYNDILTVGSFTIHGYGLMIGLGVLFGFWMAFSRAKKRGLDSDMIFNIGLQGLVYGLLGAKLLYLIIDYKSVLDNPWSVISGGGFVVFGGIISGTLAAFLYCRKKNLVFLDYFDLLIPSVALAQAFGRIGCFLAGCCYGAETSAWYGITFLHSDFAPNNVKLIPTQILMSVGDFLIVLILLWFARKRRKPGQIGGLYLCIYSVGRFAIEFIRNDYRGTIGFLSVSQFIGVFTFALGIFLMVKIFKEKKKDRPETILDGLKDFPKIKEDPEENPIMTENETCGLSEDPKTEGKEPLEDLDAKSKVSPEDSETSKEDKDQ